MKKMNDIIDKIIVKKTMYWNDEKHIEVDVEIKEYEFNTIIGTDKNLFIVHHKDIESLCPLCEKKWDFLCEAFELNQNNKQKLYDAVMKKYRVKFLVEKAHSFGDKI